MSFRDSRLLIYTTEDGLTKVETVFDQDTVWLSIDQIAELFQRDKSTISRHIRNVFSEGELKRDSVVANFATTAADVFCFVITIPASIIDNIVFSKLQRSRLF